MLFTQQQRAYGTAKDGPSAIADLRGLNLRGALNQGHSRNPRQGAKLDTVGLDHSLLIPLARREFL